MPGHRPDGEWVELPLFPWSVFFCIIATNDTGPRREWSGVAVPTFSNPRQALVGGKWAVLLHLNGSSWFCANSAKCSCPRRGLPEFVVPADPTPWLAVISQLPGSSWPCAFVANKSCPKGGAVGLRGAPIANSLTGLDQT